MRVRTECKGIYVNCLYFDVFDEPVFNPGIMEVVKALLGKMVPKETTVLLFDFDVSGDPGTGYKLNWFEWGL